MNKVTDRPVMSFIQSIKIMVSPYS